MRFGIGLGLGAFIAGLGVPSPSISSLSSPLADPLGGDSVTITGVNLSSASSVTWNGVAQTITGNTSTTVTITTVAPGANGSLSLVVTTPGGTASTTMRSWWPGLITGCTVAYESPNYAKVSTTGTWTARTGSNATNGGLNAPSASSGAPLTTGATQGLRLAQNLGAVMTMTGTPEGSTFAIVNPTSFSAHGATFIVDPPVWVEEGRGGIGQTISGSGSSGTVTSTATDGTYKTAQQAIVTGVEQAVFSRFKSGVDIGVRVGSAAWTNTVLGTYSPVTTNLVQLFDAYNESSNLLAKMSVFIGFNKRIADADSDDCYSWAKVRHGAS